MWRCILVNTAAWKTKACRFQIRGQPDQLTKTISNFCNFLITELKGWECSSVMMHLPFIHELWIQPLVLSIIIIIIIILQCVLVQNTITKFCLFYFVCFMFCCCCCCSVLAIKCRVLHLQSTCSTIKLTWTQFDNAMVKYVIACQTHPLCKTPVFFERLMGYLILFSLSFWWQRNRRILSLLGHIETSFIFLSTFLPFIHSYWSFSLLA